MLTLADLLALAPDTSSFESSALSTYAWAFGQGVLVDLTPCVYPLIPVTVAVFGAKGVSRGKALFLASAYVLGMAVLYTTLGVVVALTGTQFGAWLADPMVVLPIAGLLLVLAASMFGAFDLQLPAGMQTRLNSVGGAGPFGAFLMGLVSGFISAPCTGPVLLSLLAYIAKSSAQGGSVAYGGSLLFTYALGMGTLFFAVALGASLFRPGKWMEYIKSVFGVALVVMALWFVRPISPELRAFVLHPEFGLWIGMGLGAVGILAGAIHLSFYGGIAEKTRKAIAVLLAILGFTVALNNVMYVSEGEWKTVSTLDEFGEAVTIADEFGKPVVIDFGAEWCNPCKEMDLITFADERVEGELSARFELIKIKVDNVDDAPDKQVLFNTFVQGSLPGVVVYDSGVRLSDQMDAIRKGTAPDPAFRLNTFTGPDEFLPKIKAVE